MNPYLLRFKKNQRNKTKIFSRKCNRLKRWQIIKKQNLNQQTHNRQIKICNKKQD